ncbi:iron ABC transporter permease [Nocardioidaceae bacterium]|nr:iron ABC transporter permease [Nocardioidaceae bacterium]
MTVLAEAGPATEEPARRERPLHTLDRFRVAMIAVMATGVVVLFGLALMLGDTFYGPSTIGAVISERLLGTGDAGGASFTVGDLRLPRAVTGLLAGLAFGAAGTTFQTLLRNPLAAPDVIGITGGASLAAVVSILAFGLTGAAVSFAAIGGALVAAAIVLLLADRGGLDIVRVVLIGIALAAMAQAGISTALLGADEYDLATAFRWLAGSLNNASWDGIGMLLLGVAVGLPVLALLDRQLRVLQLGDDAAAGLGVRVEPVRRGLVVTAVLLLAVAVSATGPIAFVAFLAGPIASQVVRRGSLLVPAMLMGAILVLGADLAAGQVLPTQYPVGVVTGALGAPFLIFLLIRQARTRGVS